MLIRYTQWSVIATALLHKHTLAGLVASKVHLRHFDADMMLKERLTAKRSDMAMDCTITSVSNSTLSAVCHVILARLVLISYILLAQQRRRLQEQSGTGACNM